MPVDTQQEELKIKENLEEEDLEKDSVKKRDASCLDSLTKNDVVFFHEKGSTANVNLSKIITPGKEEILEGCKNNVQITDEDNSVKNNVANKKQNKFNSSLVQWESDDPRKGGKVYPEELVDENTKDRDTTFKERSLSKKRISNDTSRMQMEETNSDKDAGFSLLRTISEKGHDLISKFVKGIFSNRKTEDSGNIPVLKLEISLRFDKKYFGIIQGFQR